MGLRAYWRFVVVFWNFLPLLWAYARDRRRFLLFGGRREVSTEQRRARASKLLDAMLTLGPTFVKLGQLLSTRPDILPPEYLAEFAKLQDRVPPADWSEARTVVESELGPVDERFDEFDTDPISGASLGQVYEARVDGRRAAVKVRRPGVERLVTSDLRVVRWSLPLLKWFVDESRSFSLETLADEFDETIRQEMDYEREARMLTEIRDNFADDETIRIPEVIESHSTERVLTMEYVDGTKITDIDGLDDFGIDRGALAERLQYIYLQMILEDGVFHADPHPGNLAVAADGTIVMYDFGMSGYIDPQLRGQIVEFYTAVVRQDIDRVLDTLVEMGTLSPNADRQLMSEIFELAITDLQGGQVDDYRIQQIVGQIEDTIYEFPLRLPPNLALVIRVVTVVEGVCVALAPDFDFISVGQEYLTQSGFVEEGIRQYAAERGQEVTDAAGSALRVPPKLETALDRANRGDLEVAATLQDPDGYFERLARRMVYGMAFAAGVVSTTILAVATDALRVTVGAGVVTLLVGYLLYRSFQSGITLYTEPQFTRQRMRGGDGREAALGFGDTPAEGDDQSTPTLADIPTGIGVEPEGSETYPETDESGSTAESGGEAATGPDTESGDGAEQGDGPASESDTESGDGAEQGDGPASESDTESGGETEPEDESADGQPGEDGNDRADSGG